MREKRNKLHRLHNKYLNIEKTKFQLTIFVLDFRFFLTQLIHDYSLGLSIQNEIKYLNYNNRMNATTTTTTKIFVSNLKFYCITIQIRKISNRFKGQKLYLHKYFNKRDEFKFKIQKKKKEETII